MASTATLNPVPVSQDTVDACIAWAVSRGDMVNFRFCFISYSPLRSDSTEDVSTPKYSYLRPADENDPHYREALELVQRPEIRDHVSAQLSKKGQAQLPWELVLKLADNAVRLNKMTTAAQAYELLRIRRRMMELFYVEGDRALDDNRIDDAVRAYAKATALGYDYAAFPEPLPAVPNYQTRALMMHAIYPQKPEDCIALQPPDTHLRAALGYLLSDEAAARLDSRPAPTRVAFLETLVRTLDPEWDAFAKRYHEACDMILKYGDKNKNPEQDADDGASLAEEIEKAQKERDWNAIPATLLGRPIDSGAWWQYLKELAYQHPAAPLFISRQIVSRDVEILMPRYVKNSEIVQRLGLAID